MSMSRIIATPGQETICVPVPAETAFKIWNRREHVLMVTIMPYPDSTKFQGYGTGTESTKDFQSTYSTLEQIIVAWHEAA